ncbi:DUF397 domain-containing protein [Streptomyces sp. NBC_00658]|uniref:DUF397 domain-containing protein n=1 Tax=Streptomyces sp. NBC_00658 TaxID=2975800 RepID=UPI003246E671
MQTTNWQKSTFSGDSSNCVYVAAPTPVSIHLRESDEPDIILATSPSLLRMLIRTLKGNLLPQ